MFWIRMLVILAVFLVPGTARAQRVIGGNAGVALPFGELNDASGWGASFAGDVFFGISDRFEDLRWGGRIAYNNFGTNNYESFGSNASSTASTIEIVPSLQFLLTNPEDPQGYFAQVGVGVFVTSIDFTDIPDADDDTSYRLGVTVGGGYTYRIANSLHAVVTPLYHFTDKNYLSVNVGLLFGNRERPVAE